MKYYRIEFNVYTFFLWVRLLKRCLHGLVTIIQALVTIMLCK